MGGGGEVGCVGGGGGGGGGIVGNSSLAVLCTTCIFTYVAARMEAKVRLMKLKMKAEGSPSIPQVSSSRRNGRLKNISLPYFCKYLQINY